MTFKFFFKKLHFQNLAFRLIGFDDLSGDDKFPTELLEKRLQKKGELILHLIFSQKNTYNSILNYKAYFQKITMKTNLTKMRMERRKSPCFDVAKTVTMTQINFISVKWSKYFIF
jgi:hypothetical protein